MQKMINTSECEKCQYGEVIDESMAKILVRCKARGKNYIYGQCIPCNDMKKKEKGK